MLSARSRDSADPESCVRDDLLRFVQIRSVEAPFRVIRAVFALWLVLQIALAWPHAMRSAEPWQLFFVLLGLRFSGLLLRKQLKLGYALGVLTLLLGFAPTLVALATGQPTRGWLLYLVVVVGAFRVVGPRSLRALRDLLRHGPGSSASAPP